jgi:hypothetical protein
MDYIARHYHMDVALTRALRLEGKSDQESFEALTWGLRTWDHWYFNSMNRLGWEITHIVEFSVEPLPP